MAAAPTSHAAAAARSAAARLAATLRGKSAGAWVGPPVWLGRGDGRRAAGGARLSRAAPSQGRAQCCRALKSAGAPRRAPPPQAPCEAPHTPQPWRRSPTSPPKSATWTGSAKCRGARSARCAAAAPGRAQCSPARLAARRSDLSEATLPGSIISMIAMVSMVILFFLVRPRARSPHVARRHIPQRKPWRGADACPPLPRRARNAGAARVFDDHHQDAGHDRPQLGRCVRDGAPRAAVVSAARADAPPPSPPAQATCCASTSTSPSRTWPASTPAWT